MGIRVSADLIRDVAKALDSIETLELDTSTTAEFLLNQPIKFTSDNARPENRYEFKVVVRYDENTGVYFEVVL